MTEVLADSPRPRLAGLDQLRGLAFLAMVSYHGAWDLAFVGFVDWEVTTAPAWTRYAVAIASSFLLISGFSSALAIGRPVIGRLWRLGQVALGAALVTAGTYFLFPDSYVFFGILHHMALAGLLALVIGRLPAPVILVLAVGAFALPQLVSGGIFDWPPLAFVGLSSVIPVSNDYVPLFPWLAAFLAGLGVGRLMAPSLLAPAAARGSVRGGAAGRALAFIGRHSLVLYLIHQPLLFGAIAGAAEMIPPDPAVVRSGFISSCEAGCSATSPAATCTAMCACIAEAMDGTAFFSMRGGDPAFTGDVQAAATVCAARAVP